jgi:hypothetical protein
MHLAAIGVLLAIGIASLRRGQVVVGWACVAGAVAVAVWLAVIFFRARG